MITFYDLLNIFDCECEIEVFEWDGDKLQEGFRGNTLWDDDLLDRPVYKVLPGIVTKVYLRGGC